MLQVHLQNKKIKNTLYANVIKLNMYLFILYCRHNKLLTAYSHGRGSVILQGQETISYWGKCVRVYVSVCMCV